MTAEIAILNTEAVALAADSAVTTVLPSGEKIFTSANKLFSLSKYHPVGIMVYGSALFMGIPWETLIKVYRSKRGDKSFPTIREYGEDFLRFLANNTILPKEIQIEYIQRVLLSYLEFIKERYIKEEIKRRIRNYGKVSEDDIEEVIGEIINNQYKLWEKGELSDSIDDEKSFHKKVIDNYGEIIDFLIKKSFRKLPIRSHHEKIRNLLAFLIYKFPKAMESPETSGIVIAGFGEKELFPSLVSYKIEGFWLDVLKYKIEFNESIRFNRRAIIIPFAQKDMVYLFMEGIHREYLTIEKVYLTEFLRQFLEEMNKKFQSKINNLEEVIDSAVDDFEQKLKNYRRTEYTDPILNIVEVLPKSELATMAETLVNLTSLKRKWSPEQETVGGPIDVALISKGDGFIWIKRKHYFDPKLNPYFFQKYFKKEEK